MTPAHRRWLEVAVRCPGAGDRAALLADGLLLLGGRAIEERGAWFVTHVEDPGDVDAFLRRACDALAEATGLSGIEVRGDWRDHEDWSEVWKRGLAPRRITDRLVVRPSWTGYPGKREGDVVLVVDPGMAFGTAEHGTTRGCLRLLDRVVRPGDRVIDVGAGSGILAIACARLGASEVLAIEGDPLACEAMAENLERNGVADRVRVSCSWADAAALRALQPASGVVANLESGILEPLVPGLVGAMAPEGWLIVSGLLAEEWPMLRAVLEEAGCRAAAEDADGDWRSALLRRRP